MTNKNFSENKEIFQKTVLVTGGCGFIGSNYLNDVVSRTPDTMFVNVDNLFYSGSVENIKESTKSCLNYVFVKANIADHDFMIFLLKLYKVTHIVHFAAQTHVDNSFGSGSVQFVQDNVKGTLILLEAVRQVSTEILFLHFSTDEVYGESLFEDMVPKTEISLLCPTNPYAASKASAEMMVTSYQHSFGLKCIVTRCNNVYGRHQFPEKLIPKFINNLLLGKKCPIQGTGNSLRSFIHVSDVCSAVELILQKGEIGNVYNIGSELCHEKSVIDVFEHLVFKIKGKETDPQDWCTFVEDRPYNDKRYFISNNKIKLLGWEQKISFEDGINDILNNIDELSRTEVL